MAQSLKHPNSGNSSTGITRICNINFNSESITLQYIKLCQQRLSDYAFQSFSTSAIQPSNDGTPKKALQAFLSTSIKDKTMPYMPHDSLLCGFEDQFRASNIVWEAALRPFWSLIEAQNSMSQIRFLFLPARSPMSTLVGTFRQALDKESSMTSPQDASTRRPSKGSSKIQ